MKTRNVGILLLITILFLNLPIIVGHAQPTEPHNADAMWIEPSSVVFNMTNGTVGEEFNVTVWMNITEDVFSYQIGLHYNRTQLMCTHAAYTDVSTSNFFKGHTTSSPAPIIDTSSLGNGSILAFETLLDSDMVVGPHCDSLIWAEFQILTVPTSGNLTSTLDISTEYPSNTWVLDPNLNNINIVPYNANYLFIGPKKVTPPSALTVSISASKTSITLGQSVAFTSTVTGGTQPYTTYQWFVNSTAFPGATSGSWTYTPINAGSANVYLNVTDSKPTTAESNTITITIQPAPPPTKETEISVYPPEIVNLTLTPSHIFSININLTSVSSLSSCQFNLTFAPQILNWVGIEVLRVESEVPIALTIANAGSVWVNLTYATPISADPPEPIVTIYFHVVGFGTSPLNLTDTTLLDANGNPITHSESDGLFTNGKVDLAVTNVVPALTLVTQGSTDNINVTVKNLGSMSETNFNASAYYNTTLIGTTTIASLASNASTTVTIPWNTTGVPAGNYTIIGKCTILPFDINITNNVYTDGTVQVTTLIHDVEVTGIMPLERTWGYQGFPYNINVTTKNDGNFTESFNVTLYANSTTIGTFSIINLAPNTSNTTTVSWDTTSAKLYQNYTLSAQASLVPHEFNVTNNYLVDGIVQIRLAGDVTIIPRYKVDGRDLTIIALALGSSPGSPNWNPAADINGDNKVDAKDIILAAKNFGKIYP
jgi:hypothetical protein